MLSSSKDPYKGKPEEFTEYEVPDQKDLEQKPESLIKGRKLHSIVELSNGDEAYIHRGKGKDSVRASVMINGDQEKYFAALMHLLVRIKPAGGDKSESIKLTMEDFDDMDMADYNVIAAAIMEVSGNA